MYVKTFIRFCQALKKMRAKENCFLFSASRCRTTEIDSTAYMYVLYVQLSSFAPRICETRLRLWHVPRAPISDVQRNKS